MAPRSGRPAAIKELHYKYYMLMNNFHNKIFVMQSEIYVSNNVKTENIELQVIWRSVTKGVLQTFTKHISIKEDYNKLLQETYQMCKNIIKDAESFGEASYWEILKNL